MDALGLIEVKGYLAAVEASDAALKAANVQLINMERIRGGYVTVQLTGDVGAVNAAVAAGSEAANQFGVLISKHVISRAHEETHKLLTGNLLEQDEQEKVEEVIQPLQAAEQHEQVQVITNEETTPKEETPKEDVALVPEMTEEKLYSMTVADLRKLAREIHPEQATPNDIKFGKKEYLVSLLAPLIQKG
ncbi:BMC domain-containing protein [Pontibacillus litoralis]|uniref:BMC domain-containing protein n=1 Tax=Pontibacillus litoralis JSM 072002 TaxID=1385512 RepID=A0A0A5HLP3_9BACI|nr:BMC domain-containing protein [Pontibacillus litoralis]KGX84507.1 hypothetical protein N784_13350 [Pontibacillus litoralis JSM 072002]